MQKFGFGDEFIRWVEILYKNPKASVKVNGWISNEFSIFRGIRQGCPVSALIFILCVEILAVNIRNNQELKGINLPGKHEPKEIKISQFADDCTLFLADSEQIILALEIVNNFTNVAGPRLNITKSEGMWIGSLRNNTEKPAGIAWPSVIRYLGIYIGKDENKCYYLNWLNKKHCDCSAFFMCHI